MRCNLFDLAVGVRLLGVPLLREYVDNLKELEFKTVVVTWAIVMPPILGSLFLEATYHGEITWSAPWYFIAFAVELSGVIYAIVGIVVLALLGGLFQWMGCVAIAVLDFLRSACAEGRYSREQKKSSQYKGQ